MALAPFLWMVSSLPNWEGEAESRRLLQYSRCDRTSAMYASLNSLWVRDGEAFTKAPTKPLHFFTVLSIWSLHVRWWSRLKPSNFTAACGFILCPSSMSSSVSGNLLDGVLKIINCVLAAFREISLSLQNDLIYHYTPGLAAERRSQDLCRIRIL